MISNNFMHVLFSVLMWLSLFGSIVFYVFMSKKLYNTGELKKGFYYKNKKYFVALGLLFLAFVSFLFEFYSSEDVYFYLHSIANINIDALHIILMIIGAILSSISIYIFISKFIEYFYSNDKGDHNKKDAIFLVSFLLISILSITLFIEGNAPYLKYPLPNRIYIGIEGIHLITGNTGYDWSPAPGDGLQIALYAICILFGACLVLSIDGYLIKKLYGEDCSLTTLFLIAFPCGIIGARAWYVVGNWELDGFNTDPSKIFKIWNGGLTIIGGAVFGAAMGILFMLIMQYVVKNKTYKKINLLMLIDIACASILLAQGIGRFGNFFNNEVHGNLVSESSYSWLPTIIRNNMKFSNAHKVYNVQDYLTNLNNNQIYLPLFLIEGIFNIIGFIVLEFVFRVVLRNMTAKLKVNFLFVLPFKYLFASGSNLGYYLIWYGTTRYILEPLRDPAFNMGNDGSFSVNGSLVMIIAGVVLVIFAAIYQFIKDARTAKLSKKGN